MLQREIMSLLKHRRFGYALLMIMASYQMLPGQSISEHKDQWPILNGEYFGQTKPGSKPMIFGKGLISLESSHEYGSSFTPDANEFYFTRREPDKPAMLYVTKQIQGNWLRPEPVMTQIHEPNEAHISPDGQRLFFGTREALFVSTKSGSGWSEPSKIGPGMYITATREGTIYYTNTSKRPLSIVKRSLAGEAYSDEKVVAISDVSTRDASHPFISPKEDYLILNISGDLYISLGAKDGNWEVPKRLGDDINTSEYEFAPYVSADGNYFFFSRGNEDRTNIYWVQTSVLFK